MKNLNKSNFLYLTESRKKCHENNLNMWVQTVPCTAKVLLLSNQRVKTNIVLQNNEIIGLQIWRVFQISSMRATGPTYHCATLPSLRPHLSIYPLTDQVSGTLTLWINISS
jgi:hypothetical protein